MAALRQQLWNAFLADEVQRTNDDQIVVLVIQQLLDLPDPVDVTVQDDRLMQFIVVLHVGEQIVFEEFDIAVAPGIDQVVHDVREVHAFRQRLNEHVALRPGRQAVQNFQLLAGGFQPSYFLVITLGILGQVKFNSVHWTETDAHQHHYFNRNCCVPWF